MSVTTDSAQAGDQDCDAVAQLDSLHGLRTTNSTGRVLEQLDNSTTRHRVAHLVFTASNPVHSRLAFHANRLPRCFLGTRRAVPTMVSPGSIPTSSQGQPFDDRSCGR